MVQQQLAATRQESDKDIRPTKRLVRNDKIVLKIDLQEFYHYKSMRSSKRPSSPHGTMTFSAKKIEVITLDWHVRAILVNWMVHVSSRLELWHETLFLSVELLHRFLGKCQACPQQLLLVAKTAFLLSTKYEERAPPANWKIF